MIAFHTLSQVMALQTSKLEACVLAFVAPVSQECSSAAFPWGVDTCCPRVFPFFPLVEEEVVEASIKGTWAL